MRYDPPIGATGSRRRNRRGSEREATARRAPDRKNDEQRTATSPTGDWACGFGVVDRQRFRARRRLQGCSLQHASGIPRGRRTRVIRGEGLPCPDHTGQRCPLRQGHAGPLGSTDQHTGVPRRRAQRGHRDRMPCEPRRRVLVDARCRVFTAIHRAHRVGQLAVVAIGIGNGGSKRSRSRPTTAARVPSMAGCSAFARVISCR